jgi:phosphatidylserine/phosphatidylglycerophosphate/cardiolipin synthase-like enzyme
MKYARYGFALSFIIGALGIVGSFKVPKSFGKTHFIIGCPKRYYTQKAENSSDVATKNPVAATRQDALSAVSVDCVLFAPDDDVQQALVNLIDHETSKIRMAIFMLTTKEIVNALLAAHARGVKITIITDSMCVRDRWSKMDRLKKAGIAVYEYTPTMSGRMNNLMHHKFVVFSRTAENKSLVWTGSFNFTKSAQTCNQENAVILSDAGAVEKFSAQFKRIKKRSRRL